MSGAISLADLRQMGIGELEQLYSEQRPVAVPRGRFHGHHLLRLDTPGARHPLWWPVQVWWFKWTPFGVDFDARLWFFWHPALAAGRFEPRPGRSRWRDTDAVGLHYHVSRLPGPVRGVLYDEVKPLSADLCLCIGGINAPRGQGDHFFFALRRR